MRFQVLTLFPEMIRSAASSSVIGRAAGRGLISVETINIRDYSANRHNRVDDYPYGGGAGMVMEAEPVYRSVRAALEKTDGNARVVYLTPQAPILNQEKVEELAGEKELILLCGHYEGIDERVLGETVTDYISIGDYVLTGGELGALVLIDAVSRFVPGVLGNEESAAYESHQDGLLEYPHYTRPEIWHGKQVPEILLCGDHKKVEQWRHEQSLIRTRERRPDLLEGHLNVHVLFAGGEDTKTAATEICRCLKLAEMPLDYGRNKLQRSPRRFGPADAVILLCGAGISEEALQHILRGVRAEETAIFVLREAEGGDRSADCGCFPAGKGFRSVMEEDFFCALPYKRREVLSLIRSRILRFVRENGPQYILT